MNREKGIFSNKKGNRERLPEISELYGDAHAAQFIAADAELFCDGFAGVCDG